MEAIDYATKLAEEAGEDPGLIERVPVEVQRLFVETSEAMQRGARPAVGARWSQVSRLFRELSEDWRRGREVQLEAKPDRFTLSDARLFVSARFKLLSALPRNVAVDVLEAYLSESGDDFDPDLLVIIYGERRGWFARPLETFKERPDGRIVMRIGREENSHLELEVFPFEARFSIFQTDPRVNVERAIHVLMYGPFKMIDLVRTFDRFSVPRSIMDSPLKRIIVSGAQRTPRKAWIELWYDIYNIDLGNLERKNLRYSREIQIANERGESRKIKHFVKGIGGHMPRFAPLRDASRFTAWISFTYAVPEYPKKNVGERIQVYNMRDGYSVDKHTTIEDLSMTFGKGLSSISINPRNARGTVEGLIIFSTEASKRFARRISRLSVGIWEYELLRWKILGQVPSTHIRLHQPHDLIFLAGDADHDALRRLALLQDPKISERAEGFAEQQLIVPL